MELVLEELQTTPCRLREVSENEKLTFSDCNFLQRYMSALDLFNIPESTKNYTNIELPSKYIIHEWLENDPEQDKVWKTKRTKFNEESSEEVRTFVKTIHLLNPIEVLKEKFVCPVHPLLPQNKTPWMATQLKIHNTNNQAYVDTVANFVLSRFRELDLTPHCVYYYGAATGICNKYQYNISAEYDTYRHCKWFWRGMKSHGARLTVLKGDSGSDDNNSDNDSTNFDEIYKEITTCPFEDTEESDSESVTEVELEPVAISDDSHIADADLESVKSFDFDNIEEKDGNKTNVFELNKTAMKNILKAGSDNDSCDENSDDVSVSNSDKSSTKSDSTLEVDLDICLEIPNMPVVMVYQEAQDGVLDELLDEDEIDGHERGSQGWEARWIAWMFQVIAALTFLQSSINFTHNDLHSNNILWRETDKRFLYYRKKDGTTWRVPTFGKILTIIDFGRSIFKLGDNMWISDDHWPDQDAGDQYNFGPFFDSEKPENLPNPSFDLCRLAISLIDGLWDETPPKKKGKGVSIMSQEGSWKMYETQSPLFNLLWSWTINDAGQTVYEDKDGEEKYEGFDLYIRIAHDVHNSVPKDQLHKTIFNQFKWKQVVPSDEKVYSLGV
jgi:hypothetical protein